VRFHTFALHPHTTRTAAIAFEMHHHIQAIKFCTWRISRCRAAENLWLLREDIASTYFSTSELKRCCHVTHKSKANVKWNEEKALWNECDDEYEILLWKFWKYPNKITLCAELKMYWYRHDILHNLRFSGLRMKVPFYTLHPCEVQ